MALGRTSYNNLGTERVKLGDMKTMRSSCGVCYFFRQQEACMSVLRKNVCQSIQSNSPWKDSHRWVDVITLNMTSVSDLWRNNNVFVKPRDPWWGSSGVTRSWLQGGQYWCYLKVFDPVNMHTREKHSTLYRLKVTGIFKGCGQT